MTIIAFDVSKNDLVGVRINKRCVPLEDYQLQNSEDAIRSFLDELQLRFSAPLIASEATAEYHRTLAQECIKRGIPFRLLNPILTKQFTRATIRKKKTDLSDALIIAKLAAHEEGSLLTPESFAPVKTITRTERKLAAVIQMFHLMEKRLTVVLPEEKEVHTALLALKQQSELSRKLLAKRSQELTDPKLQKLLGSIPGVGPTIAATLISEIGTVTRFSSGKALVAYAGLDPKVRQSGMTLKRNTRITKRGSPYLRRSIYIAASIAQRHDPELKNYFMKKTSEGKAYKEATVAVARKLLNRIFAVWKRGTPYVPVLYIPNRLLDPRF